MNLIINTDGAARGNPGQASYGFVVKSAEGVILHEEGKAIGVNTNNFAEYMGVLKALDYVNTNYQHKAPHIIEIVCDSMLVVKQLSGLFKIKNSELKKLFEQVKILEYSLGDVRYKNVPRAQNYIADRLANKALDERLT